MEAKKLFLRIISIGAAIIIISGGYVINKAFTGNTKFEEEEVYVYVPTDSKYEDVKKILAPYIENQSKIDWVYRSTALPNTSLEYRLDRSLF